MDKKAPFLYNLSKLILGPMFKLYYNPKIIGKENIPKEGPIIIVGNHKHVFDQCSIIISTKRGINYLAKKEYFDNKKIAWFFKKTGCISVDRSKKDNKSTKQALNILKENGAIGIFPEGTRNKTEEFILPFKFGAVSMAKKSNALLIPFGITGDYKFRSKNLMIRIGKPIKSTGDLDKDNKKLYKEIEKLMKKNLKDIKRQ